MATEAVFAPARVNLIGEHTDYTGGLVLPVAIDLGTTVTWRPLAGAVRVRSLAFGETVEVRADGSADGEPAGWGRFVGAVTRLLHERGRPDAGIDAELSSTVPLGGGLSSSAALTVSLSLALCRAASFEVEPLELARLARAAEHAAVGVPCGLMDPAASLLARRGHALLLDCGSEELRHVPLPQGVAIVVVDSGVRHSLEHSGYADRRAELERALAELGGRRPSELGADEAVAAAAGLDPVAVRRLRHVVSENERVRRCVAALERPGGADLFAVRELFRASHESLRDDFAVSTPELDLLVDLADESGALAARMTGGGFGGSIVALAPEAAAERLAGAVVTAYRERTGREARARVCATADGAARDGPGNARGTPVP